MDSLEGVSALINGPEIFFYFLLTGPLSDDIKPPVRVNTFQQLFLESRIFIKRQEIRFQKYNCWRRMDNLSRAPTVNRQEESETAVDRGAVNTFHPDLTSGYKRFPLPFSCNRWEVLVRSLISFLFTIDPLFHLLLWIDGDRKREE